MNNFIIYFAVWIMLVPFFGIPNVWRNYIISLSGLILCCIYLYPIVLKKLSIKTPTKRTRSKVSIQKDLTPKILIQKEEKEIVAVEPKDISQDISLVESSKDVKE